MSDQNRQCTDWVKKKKKHMNYLNAAYKRLSSELMTYTD